MELVSFEEAFNQGFDSTHKNDPADVTNYITKLVEYLYKNKYIDDDTLDDLNDYVESTVVNRIIIDLKIDVNTQIINHTSLYGKYASKYLNRINRYLLSLKNHCQAAKMITDGKLEEILNAGAEYDKEIAKALNEQMQELKNESSLLTIYNSYYRDDMFKLERALKDVSIPFDLLYTPMSGHMLTKESDFEDISRHINDLLIEARILKHFNKEQVINLLKKLQKIDKRNKSMSSILRGNDPFDENLKDYYVESDDYINDLAVDYDVNINEIEEISVDLANICEIAITNYLFSSLFKNNPGVALDDYTYKAIMKHATSVDKEELKEILDKNELGLSQEEMDYINTTYINLPYLVSSHTVTLLRN